jgi:hypothetical protein
VHEFHARQGNYDYKETLVITAIRNAAVRRAEEIIAFRGLDIDHFRGADGSFAVDNAQLGPDIPLDIQRTVFQVLLEAAVEKLKPMTLAFCNTYGVTEDDLTMTTDEHGKRHFVKNIQSAFVITQLDTIGFKRREEQLLLAYYANTMPDDIHSPVIAAVTCLVYDVLTQARL